MQAETMVVMGEEAVEAATIAEASEASAVEEWVACSVEGAPTIATI